MLKKAKATPRRQHLKEWCPPANHIVDVMGYFVFDLPTHIKDINIEALYFIICCILLYYEL